MGAVPGLAIGPVFGLRTTAIEVREEGQSPALERQALGAARFKIRKALEAVARRGGDGAGIAVAHLAFLDDPEVSAAAERTIDAGKSAGFAWRAAIEGFVAPLLASADRRSEERRLGKECVSQCRSRWSPSR